MQNYCEINAGMETELLRNKHRNGCEINAGTKCEINAGMDANQHHDCNFTSKEKPIS